MPKLSSKFISTVAGTGVAAAIVVPISIGVANSTKEHKYNKYNGSLTRHSSDLALRKDTNEKIPEITGAYFDFGGESIGISAIKEWQDNIKLTQTDDVKENEKKIATKIDEQFEKLRSEKGINPTVVINTKIMTIKNDYFDMFGWGDTTEFFNWFINDVSWGPELLTLREFDIVRGVSKNGNMVTLGGHAGTRESTLIKFYPDSFFGVQNIYDGSGSSILVDTANLGLSVNKDVIRDYINPFIKVLSDNKEALLSDDFETNEKIDNLILNKKTVEDYVEVYDGKTISALSASPLIEGSTSDKETRAVDGGFPTLDDFLTYIHGMDKVVSQDTIKDSKGEQITVYPKRYLRRILITMYGYVSNNDIKNQDILRKRILSGNEKYKYYIDKNGQADGILNKMVDKTSATTLIKNDAGDKISGSFTGADPDDGGDMTIQPYSKIVSFKQNPTLDSIENPNDTKQAMDRLYYPLILQGFNNFDSELPQGRAVEIGRIIKQITKMDVVRTTISADKGIDGKNKVSLLFEKYQNLIETIEKYKSVHNWSPVKFKNGQPELNEFVPNLYLYKYQERKEGFLDFVTSANDTFEESEVNTAIFIQESIAKHKIDFNKEINDINSVLTTKDPKKGDTSKQLGDSSYDDDLAKVIADIPFGIDEPLVEKYFQYEARTKTKVKKIGIEWLKYVASHEYGHHQTLQYAKDISTEQKKPNEGYTGVYDTKGSEVISGATINQHGFSDTYSRNYVNEYLRSRSGSVENLDPEQVSGKFVPLDETIATMQIDASAAKDDPYYAFIFNNGGKNRFSHDETDTSAPVEKSVYSYANFLTSWRAFKNPSQFLSALQISRDELKKLRGKLDGESNIAYVAYLLNALDESSYSLNPTIMAPIAPFAEGTNRAIDPMTTDSEEASKIEPFNIINGWTGYEGTDTSIAPEIHSLGLGREVAGYKTPYYKNGANPDGSIWDKLDKNPGATQPKEYSIPIPKAIAPEMLNTIKDITLDDTGETLFTNDNILAPSSGGAPYATSSQITDGITSISGKFAADFRKASDIYVNLKVDYTKGTPVYYLPDDTKAPSEAVEEEVLISSTTFKSVPLVGILRETVSALSYNAFNSENGVGSFEKATSKERYSFFKQFLVKEINSSENRLVSANLPIQQLATGKKTYSEWFDKGFGMEGIPAGQNTLFKKAYGEYLFQTYYKNFGRFLEFQKDFKETGKIVPTTYLVTAIGTSKVTTNKLNKVYASFLSQGSYSFYQQLMGDYQVNLPETINRDLNQLIYTPSTKKLQDGESSEAYDGINHNLPPILTTTFGENGQVGFVPEIGGYDKTTKVMSMISKQSGYFEDLALRRELDGSLYILDEEDIKIYYQDEIDRINEVIRAAKVKVAATVAGSEENTKAKAKLISDEAEQFLGSDDNPITDRDKWHDVFEEYGHPLSRTGKAMVNFYKDTSGATPDRDVSGFFVDKYSGAAEMFGYISKEETEGEDGYDHIALVGSDGSVKYIGMTLNMSNQFFNKALAVTGHGLDHKRVSIGEGYYQTYKKANGEEDVRWVEYDEKDIQIGWASDQFLADGFSNALLQEGETYKIYLTHGTSLEHKRSVRLGSVDTLSQDASGVYGTTHEPRDIMYNNGFDVYSGKFEITRNEAGEAIIRVRRDNDE